MARPITWAIRVTLADGRTVFLRQGGVIGNGPIATYRSKAAADADADALRQRMDARDITVIERSHGRQV